MDCRLLLVVAALLMLSPFSHSDDKKLRPETEGNLIVNGSFEEGPEVRDYLPLNKGSTAIKGWKVTRGQIDLVESHWQAADGKRSIDIFGSPGLGGVAQTFKTIKGQRYQVTFSLAGSPDDPERKKPIKEVTVMAAGQNEKFDFDTAGKTRKNMEWVTKTWEFEAKSENTKLEFCTLETGRGFYGPAIDNVSVVAVRSER